MARGSFYPIIMTENLRESINFYEDYLDFVPELEMDCFAVVKSSKNPEIRIGLIARDHESLPEASQKQVQGIVLSYPVDSVNETYRHLYMEGIEIEGEPSVSACGRRHFMFRDPNGILIDVSEDQVSLETENDNAEEFIEMMESISVNS